MYIYLMNENMLDSVEEGDIIEPENWRNPEDQQFNHSALVMSAMRKCLDLGSKELREGWWEEKVDKLGNVHRTYHEDTRKAFIESVRCLMMIMSCDFDDEEEIKKKKEKMKDKDKKYIPPTERIYQLLTEIKTKEEYWKNEEWTWWNSLTPPQQKKLFSEGKSVTKGYFNKRLEFDNYFYEDETRIYREIFSECNKQTYEVGFYEQMGISA